MKSHCLNYLLHANLNLKSFIPLSLLLDCSSKLLIMMMSITTSAAATTTTTSASSLDTLKMTDNEHQIKTSQSHGQLVLLQYWAKSSVFALPQNLGIANNKYHYPEFDVKPRCQGYLFTIKVLGNSHQYLSLTLRETK